MILAILGRKNNESIGEWRVLSVSEFDEKKLFPGLDPEAL